MATEKSSGEDAKTLDDSNDSAPNGPKAGVTKSKESKPSVDETRKRAYEIFQARHGGPGSALEDWQKAEAAASADAANADTSKADAAKATPPKQMRPRQMRPRVRRYQLIPGRSRRRSPSSSRVSSMG